MESIIGLNTTKQKMLEYDMLLNGCTLVSFFADKNLGIMLDLSFNGHIANVYRKAFIHLKTKLYYDTQGPVSDAENKLMH